MRWVLLLALLTACAGPGGSAGGSPAALDLAGTWVLERGRGPDGDVVVPDGARITIRFDAAGVSGQACNHYGGEFVLAGSSIRLAALSMTEMACEEPLMSAESAYHAALADVRRVGREGDLLTLRGDRSELVFRLQPAVPDVALEETAWALESLIHGDAVASVQGEAWLRFSADGTLAGSTGCRDLAGSYTVEGDEVTLTALAADGECGADLAQQDSLVFEVLGDGFRARIAGDHLTLTGDSGRGLELVAVGAAAD